MCSTGKGEWRFAGFSRFDSVLAGGLSKGSVIVEHRDIKTEAGMLQWLAAALGIEGVKAPVGKRTFRVLEAVEDGFSGVPPSIALKGPPCPLGRTSKRANLDRL